MNRNYFIKASSKNPLRMSPSFCVWVLNTVAPFSPAPPTARVDYSTPAASQPINGAFFFSVNVSDASSVSLPITTEEQMRTVTDLSHIV